ncbi:MAG: tyrosine-type recombinase/integrase [Candidatus Competibacteraceae bacterium]|nr:tyrosine-type recombinase/integrase [Candidatus Competibacteraceae bacterium]
MVLRDAKDLALQRRRFFVHVRDYYIHRCLLETGLRVFELTSLRVSDFRNKSLMVRSGKGGKRRSVLLAKETQRLLAEFLKIKSKALKEPVGDEDYLFVSERGTPYTTRGIRKRVKYWFGKVGLSRTLSCHSCRHTYVSHLMAAGVDLTTVRDNAGHSSLAVTSIYSHAVKDDLGDLELYSSEK